MLYISPEDLQGMVPASLVDDATRDGGAMPDAILNAVINAAETRVHRHLGPRYPRPLRSPVPDLIIDAARIFAVYELYARNGIRHEDNPRAQDAADAQTHLLKIADGLLPLYPDDPAADPAAAALVTEPNWVDYPHGTMV